MQLHARESSLQSWLDQRPKQLMQRWAFEFGIQMQPGGMDAALEDLIQLPLPLRWDKFKLNKAKLGLLHKDPQAKC